jgi:hypothetical protein
MNLVHIKDLTEHTICKAPNSIFTNTQAYQIFLNTHATRTWGYGKYIIKRDPSQHCLAPYYAVEPVTGEVLSIR